jgi:hypothetical protein
MTVHGPNNMGSGQEVGLMMVRGTTNVTVKDTEFYDGMHGLSMLDNNGPTRLPTTISMTCVPMACAAAATPTCW